VDTDLKKGAAMMWPLFDFNISRKAVNLIPDSRGYIFSLFFKKKGTKIF
jgi:hypothetical protein